MFNIRNPQGLLQPWQSLSQFAEQLYSMFTPEAPVAAPPPAVSSESPATTSAPLPPPPKDIVVSGPTLGRARPAPSPAQFQAQVQAAALPGVGLQPIPEPPTPGRRQPQAAAESPVFPSPLASPAPPRRSASSPGAALESPAIAKHKRRPDYIGDAIYPRFKTPLIPGGGGGTEPLMGKVKSGSGNTYLVTTYSSGPNGPPDDGDITVMIPQIDPDDTIPADTWISPILSVTNFIGDTEFWCQVPIWLA